MSFFEKLKRKSIELAQQATPQREVPAAEAKETLSVSVSVSVARPDFTDGDETLTAPAVSPPEDKACMGSPPPDKDGEWIEAGRGRAVADANGLEFIPNPLPRQLDLDRLVWAKYYAFNNAFFPARLCSDQEAVQEASIEVWPIPEDKVVVEFFAQIRRANFTRFLLIEKKDVLPFWATSADCKRADYEECNEWQRQLVDRMKNKIRASKKGYGPKGRPLNTEQQNSICSRVMEIANSFLKKALEQAKEEGAKVSRADEDKESPANVLLESPPAEGVALKLGSCSDYLEEGDEICYYDKVLTTLLKFAKIVRIDPSDKTQPLLLSNEDVIYAHDQIGKKPRDSVAFPMQSDSRRPAVSFFPVRQFLNFRKKEQQTPSAKTKSRPVAGDEQTETVADSSRKRRKTPSKETKPSPAQKEKNATSKMNPTPRKGSLSTPQTKSRADKKSPQTSGRKENSDVAENKEEDNELEPSSVRKRARLSTH